MNNCKCVGVEIGSYGRQIWVHAPAHMPKDNGYCLDLCISQEVMQLWMKGITTNGCCCGHNKRIGYIGVSELDALKMIELGYEWYPFIEEESCWPFTFMPKNNMLL